MSKETWRPIPGHEGDYSVSSMGRVKTHKRRSPVVSPDKIMRQNVVEGGYLAVALCRDGARLPKSVHTLVLLAFSGPRPDGMQARHLNGIRTDNRIENLAWGTIFENIQDRRLHTGFPSNIGERNPSALITQRCADEIRKSKLPNWFLAQETGVSISTVRQIRHGHSWKDVR